MIIKPYTPSLAPEWDRLVDASRAPSFLLRRGYMEYHADRFPDLSLVAYKSKGEGGRPLALLPACRRDDEVWSHAGLTYGGWVTSPRHVGPDTMIELFEAAAAHYRSLGLKALVYKPTPYIYAVTPADDDLYALFRLGAGIEYVLASSAYRLDGPSLIRPHKLKEARRAAEAGYTVAVSDDYPAAWDILTDILVRRHGAAPVHTLAEITLLAARFPDNIRLLAARAADGTMQAATVVYLTPQVAHTQYIAATDRGTADGALTLLLTHLPELLGRTTGWIDYGTCNEDAGRVLNTGLVQQKASLGGRTVAYAAYRLPLSLGHGK